MIHPYQNHGVGQTRRHHIGVAEIRIGGGGHTRQHENGHTPVILGAVAQLTVVIAAPSQDVAVATDGKGVVVARSNGGDRAKVIGIRRALALYDLLRLAGVLRTHGGTTAQLIVVVRAPSPNLAAGVDSFCPARSIAYGLRPAGQSQGMVISGGHSGEEGLVLQHFARLVLKDDLCGVVIFIRHGGIDVLGGVAVGILDVGRLTGVAQLALTVVTGGVDLALVGEHDQMVCSGGNGYHIPNVLPPGLGQILKLYLRGHGAGNMGAVAQLAVVVVAPRPNRTVALQNGGEVQTGCDHGRNPDIGMDLLGDGKAQRTGVTGHRVGHTDQGHAGVPLYRGHGSDLVSLSHSGHGVVAGGPLDAVRISGAHGQAAGIDQQVEAGEEHLHQRGIGVLLAVVHLGHLVGGNGELSHRAVSGHSGGRIKDNGACKGLRTVVGHGIDAGLVNGHALGLQIAYLNGSAGNEAVAGGDGVLVDGGRAQLIALVGAGGKHEAVGSDHQGVGRARRYSQNALEGILGVGVEAVAPGHRRGRADIVGVVLRVDAAPLALVIIASTGVGVSGVVQTHAGLTLVVETPSVHRTLVLQHGHTVAVAQDHIAHAGQLRAVSGLHQGWLNNRAIGRAVEVGTGQNGSGLAVGVHQRVVTNIGSDEIVTHASLISVVLAPCIHLAVGSDRRGGVATGGDGTDTAQRLGGGRPGGQTVDRHSAHDRFSGIVNLQNDLTVIGDRIILSALLVRCNAGTVRLLNREEKTTVAVGLLHLLRAGLDLSDQIRIGKLRAVHADIGQGLLEAVPSLHRCRRGSGIAGIVRRHGSRHKIVAGHGTACTAVRGCGISGNQSAGGSVHHVDSGTSGGVGAARACTQLAPSVAAPSIDRAAGGLGIVSQGHKVLRTHGNLMDGGETGHLSDLLGLAVGPCKHLAAHSEGNGPVVVHGDLSDLVGDPHHRCGRAVFVAVAAAEAPQSTVGSNGKGVCVARGHAGKLHGGRATLDVQMGGILAVFNGLIRALRVAQAQLTLAVVAPDPQRAILRQRYGVVHTRGYGGIGGLAVLHKGDAGHTGGNLVPRAVKDGDGEVRRAKLGGVGGGNGDGRPGGGAVGIHRTVKGTDGQVAEGIDHLAARRHVGIVCVAVEVEAVALLELCSGGIGTDGKGIGHAHGNEVGQSLALRQVIGRGGRALGQRTGHGLYRELVALPRLDRQVLGGHGGVAQLAVDAAAHGVHRAVSLIEVGGVVPGGHSGVAGHIDRIAAVHRLLGLWCL